MLGRESGLKVRTVASVVVIAVVLTAAGVFVLDGRGGSDSPSSSLFSFPPHLREDISVFEVEIYKTDNSASGEVHDGPMEVVIIGEKDRYQAILRDPLLFSTDVEGVEENLNQGTMPERLLKVFEREGYPVSSVASLENLRSGIRENNQGWRLITGSYDTYTLERDDGQIYVYSDRKGSPILVENVSEKEMEDGVHFFLIPLDKIPYRGGSLLRSTYPLFVSDSTGLRSKDQVRVPFS